ncbi:MAG TPA: hypothetical protein VMZ53_26910 [Kofleriaceae bacterium]|nr:hypothetical protein [Kofleriaceae bacterium]
MRLIWTLAIACVIAATGVRPQLEVRQDHTEQLQRATPGTLQHLTARSAVHHFAMRPHTLGTPDARSAPLAILPSAEFSTTPPRVRALSTAWSLHVSLSQLVPAHPARAPPLG